MRPPATAGTVPPAGDGTQGAVPQPSLHAHDHLKPPFLDENQTKTSAVAGSRRSGSNRA